MSMLVRLRKDTRLDQTRLDYSVQARAQALASLRSQARVFSGMSYQDSFSAMSASRSI